VSREARPGIQIRVGSQIWLQGVRITRRGRYVSGFSVSAKADVWKGAIDMRNRRLICLIATAGGWILGHTSAAPDATTFTNSVGMKMVAIKSGEFHMGQERGTGLPLTLTYGDRYFMGGEIDEQPVHKVVISHDFDMLATEVTNAQYERFDPEHNRYRGIHGLSRGDDEAVVFVSWHEAMAFCRWLSEKEDRLYRLPTEAEWEYACRACTTTAFNTGDTLPEIYQKAQQHKDRPEVVSTVVGRTPANAWGLYDMHGNVEEWCYDWYGPYALHKQRDPVGVEGGLFRVVRGGSHNVYAKSLRSANRLSTLPEDKHWLLGFRIVRGQLPSVKPLKDDESSLSSRDVSQKKFQWEENKKIGPYFEGPLDYVKKPKNPTRELFLFHNHVPSIAWCDNGDLLAAWYSCARERGRELGVVASRFRRETGRWDEASAFFNARDRNMHGTSLFNIGNGKLVHLNGLGTDGWWSKLALVRRFSSDNGATWSKPELVDPEHGSYIAHMGMSWTQDGNILLPCDAPGGTGLYVSSDKGMTWQYVCVNGKRKNILGSHAQVVQLRDGSLYALGRGEQIDGVMPVSRSYDGGKTWIYCASDLPPVGGGQRIVLRRLNEGPLLFVGFTDTADYQKVEVNRPRPKMMTRKGMAVQDAGGNDRRVYGMFAALSFDEGKTWPVRKLINDFGPGRRYNGEGWTQNFIMDETHAEPLGYLACTQSPDNVIHLISSGLHYRFNLEWIKEPMPEGSGKSMTFLMGNKYLVKNGYESQPGIVGMEFIYDQVPFSGCHASTIVETADGLVTAWFGGTREGYADVGIWLSRLTEDGWSEPLEVANGAENQEQRHPCWNPVLFQTWEGPIYLFYKVGPNPREWWGVMKMSDDCGKTWSEAKVLPKGFLGPIKNKPVELQDETILCPASSEHDGWKVHFEKFHYKTGKWEMTGPVNDGRQYGAIQPSILMHFKDDPSNDKMQALCRTQQGVITQIWTNDRGRTWGTMKATDLPNPNSGIDALTLSNGMQLLVYNHTVREGDHPRGRELLNVAISKDGISWQATLILENTEGAEFSYPAVIQTADDLVHITYTWKRKRIKHVVIDPSKLKTFPIVNGRWPF